MIDNHTTTMGVDGPMMKNIYKDVLSLTYVFIKNVYAAKKSEMITQPKVKTFILII